MRLDGKVNDLKRFQRLDQVTTMQSAVASVQDQYHIALDAGEVTDRMMNPIAGRRQDLDQQVRLLTALNRDRLAKFRAATSQKQRLEVLSEEGFDAVQDLSALVMASRAWAMYQSLHAANLLSQDSASPASEVDQAAASTVIKQTRERLAVTSQDARELAYELDRILELATVAPGKVTIGEHIGGKVQHQKLTREQTRELALQLRTLMHEVGIPMPGVPVLPTVPEYGMPLNPGETEWRRLLSYLLEPDESLQLIVHGLGAGGNHNVNTDPSVLVLTDRRAIGLRRPQFTESGRLQLNTPLTNIQSVRQCTAYRQEVLRITLKEGLKVLRGGDMLDINNPYSRARTCPAGHREDPEWDARPRHLDGARLHRRYGHAGGCPDEG